MDKDDEESVQIIQKTPFRYLKIWLGIFLTIGGIYEVFAIWNVDMTALLGGVPGGIKGWLIGLFREIGPGKRGINPFFPDYWIRPGNSLILGRLGGTPVIRGWRIIRV